MVYRFLNSKNKKEKKFFIMAMAVSTQRDLENLGSPWTSEMEKRMGLCNGKKGHMCLLANVDDKPVGLIWLKPVKGAREDIPVSYIENLYIEPNFRGKSISVELKNRAAEWAREQGYPYLESRVKVANQSMIRLNQKLGYIQEGPEEKWGETWYWFQLKL